MLLDEAAKKALSAFCFKYCVNAREGDFSHCRACVRAHDFLYGFEEGRKETEKQWHDCFLSCSSPYCAGHFPAVKMEGELGNMSKHEGE